MSSEIAHLKDLSVKELRRQAAVKNVPLTQIAAAVEKADLINLIVKAGPVLDTYDLHLGSKVHSATTIAERATTRVEKKKKPKAKKRKRRSSSSSGSSRSSHGRGPGRRAKKSPSKKRSPVRKKRVRTQKSKSRSSSPSLTIIVPPQAPAPASDLRALPAPGAGSGPEVTIDLSGPAPPAASGKPGKPGDQPTIAQRGMAAAAALGFDVLPKAPASKPAAPAEGLRPTINSAAPVPYGASLLPGGRICIQYLCTSKCDLGGNCPEAHIIDPEEEMRVRARFKEQECHYGAQCSRPGCLFRHPGERFEEGRFVPEGQQVTLRATPQGMQLDFM
mmetsp:Transcript_72178/g.222992  ORF Transcript_72178/g.222992 Transcript_72178/m.222992 type:complete len:332 (+) Transcript_72178:97-1092(+)